jgi:hypothetical protein
LNSFDGRWSTDTRSFFRERFSGQLMTRLILRYFALNALNALVEALRPKN